MKESQTTENYSKFNAHSEPIFKSLNLLKVQDIFEICQMKFYHNYNYLNEKLPHFFNQISFQNNNQTHHYETRINSQFHLPKVKHSFAKLCIRYSLPSILNNAPACVTCTDKIKTHSLNGFTLYAKNYIIKNIHRHVLLKTAKYVECKAKDI